MWCTIAFDKTIRKHILSRHCHDMALLFARMSGQGDCLDVTHIFESIRSVTMHV